MAAASDIESKQSGQSGVGAGPTAPGDTKTFTGADAFARNPDGTYKVTNQMEVYQLLQNGIDLSQITVSDGKGSYRPATS